MIEIIISGVIFALNIASTFVMHGYYAIREKKLGEILKSMEAERIQYEAHSKTIFESIQYIIDTYEIQSKSEIRDNSNIELQKKWTK